MNLENNFNWIESEIFEGQLNIAVIVAHSEHFFVIDEKANFCIDVIPHFESYLEKGMINQKQYEDSILSYRGGVSVLTRENAHRYIEQLPIPVKSFDWMRRFFTYGYDTNELKEIYAYVQNYLMSSDDIIELGAWQKLESRLPQFYINLDRKIFMHTDWDRCHEDDLPVGWIGKASSQFWSLIPDNLQYWQFEGMNFWKLYG